MIYRDRKTKNISFPLGGIGTGSIGLGGNGSLIDWEIFNRPNKNTYNGYSHFAIKVKSGDKTLVKVLQGDTNESLIGMEEFNRPYIGFGFGPHTNSMAGFPHFRNVEFDGEFPLAKLKFTDADFPAIARLTAFNPFIPHDEFSSSLPGAFFEWEVENVTNEEMECAIAFSVQNPTEKSFNEEVDKNGFKGIFFKNAGCNENEIGYCDLCAITDHKDTDVQTFWYRGKWQDNCTTFWKNFASDMRMPNRKYDDIGWYDHGSLVSYVKIAPKGKEKIRFILTWNVPNQYNYWNPYKDELGNDVIWKNYYATQFENSTATALYSIERFGELLNKTAQFSSAIQSSTLPSYMIDAISANLSVLKTPTTLRLQDGSFWAWEGCMARIGSCEGSCQHVWNYAYALAFLFPSLERSMRENNIKYTLYESGETDFRVALPLGRKQNKFRACVDGQMGEIIKCYREWKISGDNEWIKKYASDIFRMLEYAWSDQNADKWDADKDGVIEGRQHHTLDMELFGPNSWLQGFYLLALDCAAKIADEVGEVQRAKTYRELYKKGKAWTNENLFNGEYFCQKVDLTDKSITDKFSAPQYWNDESGEIKYQIADGCIIDQMLADWHATIIGSDGVFDEDKKKIALQNLYCYNYKPSMRELTNMWRNFALNDESGTIICSYPNDVYVPVLPIPYCEECMTGFEYALAGLMMANGFISEGETMTNAIRDRYDGEKRNPWNEIECGSNYARSMASYAFMPICSGFTFDMPKKHIGFAPITGKKGQYLWSVANSWGKVSITEKSHELCIYGNKLDLCSYGVKNASQVVSLQVDGKEIEFTAEDNKITFSQVTIENQLKIKLA